MVGWFVFGKTLGTQPAVLRSLEMDVETHIYSLVTS